MSPVSKVPSIRPVEGVDCVHLRRVGGLFHTIFHAEYDPLAGIMNYFIMNYSLQTNSSFFYERWRVEAPLLPLSLW